jgi:signal transduction histidine kinase
MSTASPFPWPSDVAEPSSETNSGTSAETGWGLLFRNAPVAVAQCSALGVITTANPAFERLLGVKLVTNSAMLLSDLAEANDREGMDCLFREMIAGGRESFQIENQIRNQITSRVPSQALNQVGMQIENEAAGPRGSAMWVRWTVWRAPRAGRDLAGAVALVEDATLNHYSVRHLREAGRLEALGRLASGIAHDFNNLLTGITLYGDLLLAGLEPGNRLRKYAEEIRAASGYASGLVRQLLAVARTPNEVPLLLSLNDVAEGMRQLLLRLIGENIELVYQLDPNLGAVGMDFTRAQQILLNLVLNARDALPEGGRITLETRNCGLQIVTGDTVQQTGSVELPCALFVVSDNGQGMNSQTQQHVFEAFFSTKPPGEGTGLGLSTVYDIVTNNGGLIHIHSEGGKGTRVTVILPLILLPLISPAELPKISAADSKPPNQDRALPFPEEEPTP